jgi:hypothetical protein
MAGTRMTFLGAIAKKNRTCSKDLALEVIVSVRFGLAMRLPHRL